MPLNSQRRVSQTVNLEETGFYPWYVPKARQCNVE
jgi:hypothetical protein